MSQVGLETYNKDKKCKRGCMLQVGLETWGMSQVGIET